MSDVKPAQRGRAPVRWFVRWSACAALLAMLLASAGGCSGDLPTEYGRSKGRSGTHSINGFATLRQSFESNAWSSRDVHRLNDRLQSIDTLVWTPTLHKADESEAVDWLQDWLDERPRTLIYVLPDMGSEPAYWEAARTLAPAEQRIEYRRRYARALARAMTQWSPGALDPQDHSVLIERPWFRSKRRLAMSPGWELIAHDHTTGGNAWQYEPLLEAADGTTLVMRITRDPLSIDAPVSHNGDGQSQILVIAGGSLVSNFAMTASSGQAVARTLLAQSESVGPSEGKRVGFLRSGPEGVLVSDADEPLTSSGMELLTVWPLSLITMHLALIAIVACLIVLPIFGRPRRVKERSQSDFADHIRAVAVLMHRSGGETYAASRISDYFRRIRGEAAGPWVLPETHDQPPAPVRSHSHSPASRPAGTLASQPEPEMDEPRIESPHDPHRS